MRRIGSRRQLRILAAATVALALALGTLALRPYLGRAVRARLEAGAARHGFTVTIDDVRVGLWPPLRLTGVTLERGGRWRLSADTVEGWWPARIRLEVSHAVLQGPAGLSLVAPSTTWDVLGSVRDDLKLTLVRPEPGLVVTRTLGRDESIWAVEARDLPAGRLLEVRRLDRPLLHVGTLSGSLTLRSSAEVARFDLDMAAHSVRLPALAGDGSEPRGFGEATDLAVQVGGAWRRPDAAVEIPRWSATLDGAALSGSLKLRDLETDPDIELSLEAERLDFNHLLRISGVPAPEHLGPTAADGSDDDLGSASIAASARGRLSDPASFAVTQRLHFTPPPHVPKAIERLRGDFVQEVGAGTSANRRIDVSPSSSDFIALGDVPPLFLRALLLAEDTGFYSHPGIDLREVPAALLTDWAKGGAARGASTITQQLAKNLFLSRDRHLGRKLQELSLTLLLESTLSKARILEIYVNIIEWGPNLYGLRPAARAYFDREPKDLTPTQMAFLVSLIPGPVKYQSSFAHGTPGPGLRQLVDALLAKLRSVDALTEEEYRRALDEEIVVQGRDKLRADVPPPPASR